MDKLVELIKTSRTIMSNFAKAKTAKIGMVPPVSVCLRALSVRMGADDSTDVD